MRAAWPAILTAAVVAVGGVSAASGLAATGRPQAPATAGAATAAAPVGGVAASVRLDPLLVGLSLQSGQVAVGHSDKAMVSVTDHGTFPLASVTAQLIAPSAVHVNPPRSTSLGRLSAGATATANWILCGTTPGVFDISAKATGTDAAGHAYVAYSRPVVLVVTRATGRC